MRDKPAKRFQSLQGTIPTAGHRSDLAAGFALFQSLQGTIPTSQRSNQEPGQQVVSIPSRYDPNRLAKGYTLMEGLSFNPFKVRSQPPYCSSHSMTELGFNPFKVRSQPQAYKQANWPPVRVSIPSRYDPNPVITHPIGPIAKPVSIPSRYDPNPIPAPDSVARGAGFNPFKVRSQHAIAFTAQTIWNGCFNPFKVRSQPRRWPLPIESCAVSIPSRYDPNTALSIDDACTSSGFQSLQGTIPTTK